VRSIHPRHFIGPAFQISAQILDEKIDGSPLPHHPRQILARHGCCAGKEHRLDPAQPFPPAQIRRQIGQFAVQPGILAPRHCHTP
jgi:hypothetical protein